MKLTALALLSACAFLTGAALAAKKKIIRPKPPATSPAAVRKVDAYLKESAADPFEQSGALVPFLEQLLRVKPVHIIQWGDSHTAADDFTGGLRDQFQQRFGNGGSGFSVAGRPF